MTRLEKSHTAFLNFIAWLLLDQLDYPEESRDSTHYHVSAIEITHYQDWHDPQTLRIDIDEDRATATSV